MFDSLLGRKFTVRCKQAIKRVNERLKVIRKRKQAMLNFLRQDIADLLRDGHDSNALNRMDALIVEINHLACYDMIEKYCESILKQISLMQKQRECPDEDKEAVSTLIFAAARFSDLPELCDLRHTFMSRYGSAMESSVGLEFIEKLALRTFSMAAKIQLMQKIAQEFSVEWVSETLEHGSECANEKYGEESDGVSKDIHVIGLGPEPTWRSKISDDELENVKPYLQPDDTSIPHYVHPKRDKVLDQIDQEGKVLDGSKVPPLIRPNSIKNAIDSDDNRKQAADREDEFDDDDVKLAKIPPYLKSKAVKDVFPSDDWDKDEIPKESPGKAGKDADNAAQERQMNGPWKSHHDRPFHMIPPPYVKSKVSATVDQSDSSSPPTSDGGFAAARNKSSNVGNEDPQRDEFVVDHKRPKPRSVRRNKKSEVAQESGDAVGSDESMRSRIQQHGQRRHVARKKNTFPHQDDHDDSEEEDNIDRLLIHYSKKKTPHQSSKHREKTSEQFGDNKLESPRTRFVEDYRHHIDKPELVHPHERAVPFSPDPLAVEKVEGPARVTSMQPDAARVTCGGHAHPNLPDYEEFAARFAALRRG